MANVEVIRQFPEPFRNPIKEVVLRLTENEALIVSATIGRTAGSGLLSVYRELDRAGFGHRAYTGVFDFLGSLSISRKDELQLHDPLD